MKYTITQTRLLYVYSLDDRNHEGLLKIGEVFVDNEIADSNDPVKMAEAAKDILASRSYMSGIEVNSLYFEFEILESTTFDGTCYKAADIHKLLIKSGVETVYLNKVDGENADIWFRCTKDTVRSAIDKVKKDGKPKDGKQVVIKFRPEQQRAIDDTVEHFCKKTGKSYLWNAKMRFGKTLSGLEVARLLGYPVEGKQEGRKLVKGINAKATLILTHRPVVDKGWAEDFDKIFPEDSGYFYATRMDNDEEKENTKRKNHIQNLTLAQFQELKNDVADDKKRLILFVSMQYLRLSQYVGGKEKNEDPLKKEIMMYDWDFVMVDEAHEGIEAAAGVRVINKLKKEKTRILSLSGTPFNLLDKYEEGEIYTWDYVMEQKAKQEWDDKHFGDPNPYAELPRMQILTFTLPRMVRDERIENNEVFRFHEFFRVWTEDDKVRIQNQIKNEANPIRKDELESSLKAVRVGKFVYESAIKRFLDKLVEESDTSQYPFSRDEFRDNFRHSFWLLPGVKEAKALEEMLKQHDVFGEENGMFHIINVAGDGNIEDVGGKALLAVEDAIRVKKFERTITLSCGKLTTGVSVPEWTAVLCMKGSENTPAANYMQTIFRVQTHATLDGRQKSDCYVFDFAPDRALTAVAETAKMAVIAAGGKGSRQLKKTQKEEEEHLEAFIKLCPVLSMDEGEMGRHFSANQIFEKLSNVYIERAVRSGYADNSLYDAEKLLNLTPEQEAALGDVHDLLGSMPGLWKPDKITINHHGLGKAEGEDEIQIVYYLTSTEEANLARPTKSDAVFDNGAPIPIEDIWSPSMGTPGPLFKYLYASKSAKIDGEWTEYSKPILYREYTEPKTKDEEQKAKEEQNKEKRARMSVLRGVSIRIPLLVYGAEINDEDGQEITIENFTELVDDPSWEEYMPTGFSKKTFNILRDCFDRAIFTGAAKRIRSMVKEADNLSIEDRIAKIAKIFSYFHNPDKETVLTPWAVVNRHMSDTVGGWCLLNEEFDDNNTVENQYGEFINTPRFVDKGEVTQAVFGDYNSRILEVNSKTGLYPLYMAYSLFKTIKAPVWQKEDLTGERGSSKDADSYNKQVYEDEMIWRDVLQDNIFVVCRTTMAVSITKRTLAGFRDDIAMNIVCYSRDVKVDSLINSGVLKKSQEGVEKVQKSYLFNGNSFLRCDMIDVLRSEPSLFEKDVVKGIDFWHVYNSIPVNDDEDINDMKFSVIVGNPPYQLMGASGGNNDAPIFQHFCACAERLTGRYVSMIIPARWFAAGRESLLKDFRYNMLNSGFTRKLFVYADSHDIFPHVEIKGGVCYYMEDIKEKGLCDFTMVEDGTRSLTTMKLNEYDILIRYPELKSIVDKVVEGIKNEKLNTVDTIISSDTPFGIPSNPRESSKTPFNVYETSAHDHNTLLFHIENNKRKQEFVSRKEVTKNSSDIDFWKVFIPGGYGAGEGFPHQILGMPELAPKNSVCSQSYLYAKFNTETEARHFIDYLSTKFFRALVLARKVTQSAPNRVYKFVPLLDLTKKWSDNELYKKYNLTDEDIAFIESRIKPMSPVLFDDDM